MKTRNVASEIRSAYCTQFDGSHEALQRQPESSGVSLARGRGRRGTQHPDCGRCRMKDSGRWKPPEAARAHKASERRMEVCRIKGFRRIHDAGLKEREDEIGADFVVGQHGTGSATQLSAEGRPHVFFMRRHSGTAMLRPQTKRETSTRHALGTTDCPCSAPTSKHRE